METDRRASDEPDSLELSRRLVYLAAERTLTSWVRTVLSLMALGFVIDRFGLILHMLPNPPDGLSIYPRMLSTWGGSVLIGMGVVMALGAGVRHLRHRTGRLRRRVDRAALCGARQVGSQTMGETA